MPMWGTGYDPKSPVIHLLVNKLAVSSLSPFLLNLPDGSADSYLLFLLNSFMSNPRPARVWTLMNPAMPTGFVGGP